MPLITIHGIPPHVALFGFVKFLKKTLSLNLFIRNYQKGKESNSAEIEVTNANANLLRDKLSGAKLNGATLTVVIDRDVKPSAKSLPIHTKEKFDNFGKKPPPGVKSKRPPPRDAIQNGRQPPPPKRRRDVEENGEPTPQLRPLMQIDSTIKRYKEETQDLDFKLEMIRKERMLLEEQRKLLEQKRLLERASEADSRERGRSPMRDRRYNSPMRDRRNISPMRGRSPQRDRYRSRSPIRRRESPERIVYLQESGSPIRIFDHRNTPSPLILCSDNERQNDFYQTDYQEQRSEPLNVWLPVKKNPQKPSKWSQDGPRGYDGPEQGNRDINPWVDRPSTSNVGYEGNSRINPWERPGVNHQPAPWREEQPVVSPPNNRFNAEQGERNIGNATEIILKQLDSQFGVKTLDSRFDGKFTKVLAAVITKRMQKVVDSHGGGFLKTSFLVKEYRQAHPNFTNQALIETVESKLHDQFGRGGSSQQQQQMQQGFSGGGGGNRAYQEQSYPQMRKETFQQFGGPGAPQQQVYNQFPMPVPHPIHGGNSHSMAGGDFGNPDRRGQVRDDQRGWMRNERGNVGY